MNTGWREESLGNLVSYLRGLTYSKSDEVEFSNNIVLRANNINLATNMLDFSELKYIKDSFTIPIDKKVRKDSIIICTASGSKSHLGKVAYIDEDYDHAFGGFMGMIITGNKVLPKYLFHLMTSGLYKEFISGLSDGVNINNLKFDDLAQFSVPYPSKEEQQRIVAILDEAFDAIAAAKANAEKNLQNDRAIFESHLQSLFENINDSWVRMMIGDCVKFIDYRGKTPNKTSSGLRLLTAKNVKMGYIQDYPREYVSPEDYDGWMTRGIPKQGDVLFTTEAPLANVAQLETNEKTVFAQRIIIMQSDESLLDNTFLKYILMSKPIQQKIHCQGTGATVNGIKASLLKRIEITFPESLVEQRKLNIKFDNLSKETKRLEAFHLQKIQLLENLKKSLLHQAFSGQLTARATDHTLAEAAL